MSVQIVSKTRPNSQYVLGIKVGTQFSYYNHEYEVVSYEEYIKNADSNIERQDLQVKYFIGKLKYSYFNTEKCIDQIRSGCVNISD